VRFAQRRLPLRGHPLQYLPFFLYDLQHLLFLLIFALTPRRSEARQRFLGQLYCLGAIALAVGRGVALCALYSLTIPIQNIVLLPTSTS
jgi:hypothetical protein